MAAPVMASQSRAPPRVLMCSSKALDQRSQSDDLPVNASASMEYVVGGFETIVVFFLFVQEVYPGPTTSVSRVTRMANVLRAK